MHHLKAKCVSDSADMVIMSDRREELANTLNVLYPLADKVACSKHIARNAKVYSGILKAAVETYVHQLAKAATIEEYDSIAERMKKDKDLGEPAQAQRILDYLRAPDRWLDDWALCARFDNPDREKNSCRFGVVTSNACETWNGVFLGARAKPIAAAVHEMLDLAYSHYDTCAESALQSAADLENEELFPASLHNRLETTLAFLDKPENRLLVERMHRMGASEEVYRVQRLNSSSSVGQVQGGIQLQRLVKIEVNGGFFCSCRVFQLYGVPCKDIIAVCRHVQKEGTDEPKYDYRALYHPRLQVKAVLAVYDVNCTHAKAIDTHGLQLSNLRPHAKVVAKKYYSESKAKTTKTGRIKSAGESRKQGRKRKKSSVETRKYKCKECKVIGHTWKKCPKNPKNEKIPLTT